MWTVGRTSCNMWFDLLNYIGDIYFKREKATITRGNIRKQGLRQDSEAATNPSSLVSYWKLAEVYLNHVWIHHLTQSLEQQLTKPLMKPFNQSISQCLTQTLTLHTLHMTLTFHSSSQHNCSHNTSSKLSSRSNTYPVCMKYT